jgi:hypothetical protein
VPDFLLHEIEAEVLIMRTSRFAFAALLVLAATLQAPDDAFAKCSDEPPKIVGTWEWVDTYGGFAGESFTPESTGYEIQMEFRENGTVLVYQNLELLLVTSYTLSREPSGWTVIVDSSSRFPHPPIQYETDFFCVTTQESRDGPSLQATDACADCYMTRYVARDPVAVSSSTWGAVKELYKDPE